MAISFQKFYSSKAKNREEEEEIALKIRGIRSDNKELVLNIAFTAQVSWEMFVMDYVRVWKWFCLKRVPQNRCVFLMVLPFACNSLAMKWWVWRSALQSYTATANRWVSWLGTDFCTAGIGKINEIVTFLFLESEPSLRSLCGLEHWYFRPW